MAGSLSTALHNQLVDHVLKTTPFSVPTDIYVALYSVAPTEEGGGTELTGYGYARKIHNSWDAAAAGASENDGAITFAAASGGDWLEAVAFGLFDDIAAGNFLGWADLDTPKTAGDGETLEFDEGALDVAITPIP